MQPPDASVETLAQERAAQAVHNRLYVEGKERIVRVIRSGFSLLLQPSAEVLSALAALLPDPDTALESAIIFKPGSRTHAGVVTIEGKRYFLKRYNCRGLIYRLQNAFRRSRAVRTWWVTWAFADRGIPVPQPLICLEERTFRLLGRSYILMDFAEDADPLVTAWPTLEAVERKTLLLKLGETLGKMHRSGCLHGDLKWSNILVRRRGGGEWDVCLVDLDGSRVTSRPRVEKVQKDIRRFLRDLDVAATPEDQALFRNCWQNSIGNLGQLTGSHTV